VQHGAKSQQNQRYSCFSKALPLLCLAPKRWQQTNYNDLSQFDISLKKILPLGYVYTR
jgi:hypothetical protein